MGSRVAAGVRGLRAGPHRQRGRRPAAARRVRGANRRAQPRPGRRDQVRPARLVAAAGAAGLPGEELGPARRGHLGSARAAPALRAFQGDGVGRLRPGVSRHDPGPAGARRPLAGNRREDPRRGVQPRLRRETRRVHPVLRGHRAGRRRAAHPRGRLPPAGGPAGGVHRAGDPAGPDVRRPGPPLPARDRPIGGGRAVRQRGRVSRVQLLAGDRAAADRPGGSGERAVRAAARAAQRRRPAQRGVRPQVPAPGREHPPGVQPRAAHPGRAQPGGARAGSLPPAPRARGQGARPAVTTLPRTPHILVVNGRKVRNPVFVIGAPGAGTEMLARAFKRTPGFHLTLGQRWVLPVLQAFARTPSLARGHPEAAATVLRDAFAQGWQVGPDSCLGCTLACREAGGTPGNRPCVAEQGITRYGDASPELLYCADSLVDAFPDAHLVQIVRDGRDVVAGMLADSQALAWFRPGFVNLDAEVTHPLLGVDSAPDRDLWADSSLAGKCAMRWRGTSRLMARLRTKLSPQQLVTLRYEEMIKQPLTAARALSEFAGAEICPVDPHGASRPLEPGAWRRLLTPAQAAEVESIAGEDLRRVGYGS